MEFSSPRGATSAVDACAAVGRVSLRCSAGRCGAPVSGFVGAGAADDPDADVAEEESAVDASVGCAVLCGARCGIRGCDTAGRAGTCCGIVDAASDSLRDASSDAEEDVVCFPCVSGPTSPGFVMPGLGDANVVLTAGPIEAAWMGCGERIDRDSLVSALCATGEAICEVC